MTDTPVAGAASSSGSTRIPGIEGLRGLAAVVVMLLHLDVEKLPVIHPRGGYVGVELFFVLSGFVITNLLRNEMMRDGAVDRARYLSRRAARILPALWAVVLVTTVVTIALGDVSTSEGLRYAFNGAVLLGAYGKFTLGPFAAFWSITHEVGWYIVWPPIFLFLFRRCSEHRLRLVVTALAGLGLAWRWALQVLGVSYFYRYNAPDARGGALLMGAAVACWSTEIARLSARQATIARVLGMVAFMGTVLLAPDKGVALPNTTADIGAVLLIIGLVGAPAGARTVLAHPWVVAVGSISYGIYIWHFPMIWYWGPAMTRHFGLVGQAAIVIPVTFAVSTLSWLLLEKPIMARVGRRSSRPRPGQAPDAARPAPA